MTEMARRLLLLGASCLFLITGCSDPAPVFHADSAPQRLSDWGLFATSGGKLTPVADTLVYRPASTLYSDYAQKLRSLWIPAGQQAQVVNGELQYPVGTILSKTFYYPRAANGSLQALPDQQQEAINFAENRVLETRLLVRQASGWQPLPYIWNEEQTEAYLRVAGGSAQLRLASHDGETDFRYFVPNKNQCAGCHQRDYPDGGLHPLGARLDQLAAALPAGSAEDRDPQPQLAGLRQRGWLTDFPDIQPPTDWSDPAASLEQRALAYLDMNCGHCHNPTGPADTSALILNGQHRSATELGVCKPPVAAGGGTGSLRYGIVPGQPEQSILVYRMRSRAPDEMMPELGRALVHKAGVDLISDWITRMPGNC